MIYVLAAAAAVIVVIVVLLSTRRAPKGDDVDRFNRARQMTTEWSKRYAATGHLDLPAAQEHEPEPEPAERR